MHVHLNVWLMFTCFFISIYGHFRGTVMLSPTPSTWCAPSSSRQNSIRISGPQRSKTVQERACPGYPRSAYWNMSCLPGEGGWGTCRGLSCLPGKGGGGTCHGPNLSCRRLTGTGSNDRKFVTVLLGFDGTVELFVLMRTFRDGSLAQQEQTRTEAHTEEYWNVVYFSLHWGNGYIDRYIFF